MLLSGRNLLHSILIYFPKSKSEEDVIKYFAHLLLLQKYCFEKLLFFNFSLIIKTLVYNFYYKSLLMQTLISLLFFFYTIFFPADAIEPEIILIRHDGWEKWEKRLL